METVETSEDYEKLARKVYEDILALEGVENIDVQHNVKIKGKSGVEHQIDVYWEYKYAGISHRVLIECKYYKHNVSLIHVRNLHGLLTDIPNSSGILITTKGYQSGAEQYANYYDIGLKRIRAPEDTDWNGCIQIINVDMQLVRNHYLDIKVEFDAHCLENKDKIEKSPSMLQIDTLKTMIEDVEGNLSDFTTFLDIRLPNRQDDPETQHDYILNTRGCNLVTPSGDKLSLARLKVKYATHITHHPINIDVKNAVEAILEDFTSGEVEYMQRKKYDR